MSFAAPREQGIRSRVGGDGATSPRAGVLVTGTEVLSGVVADRNGPWLSERLRGLGVDVAHVMVVGDRRDDMTAALRFLADEGLDLVVTSGGLGPTADDLTAEVVAEVQHRPLLLDAALEGRIAAILQRLAERMPYIDRDAIAVGNAKQAMVPTGAAILEPVGTAPGLVVPPPAGVVGPVVIVLPGPPRELQPMWPVALETPLLREMLNRAPARADAMLRLFGLPESEIAQTLRVAQERGVPLERLEITTCLRRGEIEIATRYAPADAGAYDALVDVVRDRHSRELFSEDGSTVDQQVFALLSERGLTVATAESCTGGMIAARLTDPPGASAHVRGGIVAYANGAKVALADVPEDVLARHGAVSGEVATALAQGARRRLDADVGIGVTGVAGPGGGSEDKAVGLVWFAVAHGDGEAEALVRCAQLPGSRADVRERATTVALHLLRRVLLAAPAA